MKRPVIMLATYIHSAFDTRIFVKEALTLGKSGFSVSVIVPHDTNEEKEGILIVAVEQYTSSFKKLFISPLDVFSKALKQAKNSVFHIHDAQLLFIGFLLKLSGRTVIYDAHEDTLLQTQYQYWIPSLIRMPYARVYYFLEKLSGVFFDSVIVAEPVIEQYYPKKKTTLIRNFPVVESFKTPSPTTYGNRRNQLVYIGLISEPRGASIMVRAFKKASDKISIKFVMGGKFSPESLQKSIGLDEKIEYIGWLSHEQMIQTLFNSRVGIIIPEPNPRYKTNYPVKLFEYMAAGLPVIASKFGEAAKFVEECDGGILVDPQNEQEVSEAIIKLFGSPDLAEQMGNRGRELIMTKYNWENESKKLTELYDRLNFSNGTKHNER
ncbi:MAG: glycosyltransferase family 4 protein [Cyclobacteriaceae bacterium]|nr:glycosyltransferase family 4 protein [Cyclobacteriaceae bacterium]